MRRVVLLAILATILTACAPGPREQAAADIARDRAALEAQVRATAAAVDLAERAARVEADQEAIVAWGKTKATLAMIGGWCLALVMLALALGLAAVSGGLGYLTVERARLAARYLPLHVERSTMQPAPLVVTADGWLIDTRTGERARIRDAAGVDRLRLAATTQATNIALGMRAAAQIAKSARSAGPADVLSQIAASVPLVQGEEGEDP